MGRIAYVRFIVFTSPSKLPVIFADWMSSECCKPARLIGILNTKGPAAADKLSPRKQKKGEDDGRNRTDDRSRAIHERNLPN